MSRDRIVTEVDFRLPQYRDAKPEDYEFRSDGQLVRKDRWEVTLRNIAALMGADSREGFECNLLEYSIESLIERARKAGVEPHYFEELPQ